MRKSAALLLMFLLILSAVGYAQEKRFNVSVGDSPALGPADAPVTIIEFLDYQ